MHIIRCFLCFVLLGQFCLAQKEDMPINYDKSNVEPKEITQEHLKSYKADKDFNYIEVEPEESTLNKIYNWLRNQLRKFWEYLFGSGTAEGFLYFMFRILPYLVLTFLLFLLVRFFVKANSNRIITKSNAKGSVSISEEEQIIKHEDIPALIKEAIHQKNYRLAIRYYYLLSLKYLTENNTIAWQPQKTNEDYIKEIKVNGVRDSFKNITRIYDYVWYGEFGVDAIKFETLKQPFENLNNSINR